MIKERNTFQSSLFTVNFKQNMSCKSEGDLDKLIAIKIVTTVC